jgi:hypothetical protein
MRVDEMLKRLYGNGAGPVRTADVQSGGRIGGWRRSLIGRWPALEKLEKLLDRGGRGRLAVATGLLLCLGIAAASESVSAMEEPSGPRDAVALEAALAARAKANAEQAAARSTNRAAGPQAAAPAAKAQAAKPAPAKKAPATKPPAKKAPAKKAPAKSVKVKPVAGLDQRQMDNAAVIVRTAYKMKLPKRAAVIAVATAMQESKLYNLASDVLPESKRYPHQGSGRDHDSVGLFQQRSSTGWGAVRDLMKPEYSATQFLAALRQVPGWHQMDLTYAAQAVQVSAFPEAYAKHESRATAVVNAIR